jgi:hypothetical protein
MPTQLVQEIEREISRHESILQALRLTHTALTLGEARPAPKPLPRGPAKKVRSRRNKGEFPKALEQIATGAPMSNAEFKARLEKLGWEGVKGEDVRKALLRLAKSGRLGRIKEGTDKTSPVKYFREKQQS